MIPNPHDALFRAVFGQPEHARGALQTIAPAPLAEALDWSTLTLHPGSFVDTALARRHTDVLYSATWRRGGEALLYFLFEHQSSVPTDERMAFRLLRYQLRIWDRWRNDHPKAKSLPMILPIVMYRGAALWNDSAEALQDLLEREVGTETKDAIVPTGPQLIEQGRQEGRLEGRREGGQQLLMRLMRLRFGRDVDADVERRIVAGTFEDIETWSERVLAAATLADIFAD